MNEWHKAEYHAERAHQFYEAGQWAKALDALRLALAVNPEQSDWHFGMGLALEAMQRYEEAVTSYEQVLKLRGDDVEAMFHLALAQLRSGCSRQAIGQLEEVSQIDVNYEPSYCYRIAAYAQLGEHDLAEQMFYRAQQLTEDCPQCYDHIALSLAMRGDLVRAIWCWRQTLKIDPHYPDVHANLARAHWQQGQLDRAHQLFILQLREDPGDVETLLQLGNLLIEMGRHTQAREKFNRVLEQDPTVTDAYLHLGELSLQAGQLESATAKLEMAGRLASDRAGVHLGLAKVAHRREDTQEVRRHLLAEFERSGQTVPQALQLAQMLIEQDLLKQGVEVLNLLIEGDGSLPPLDDDHLAAAMLYRGVAWLSDGRIQDGMTQCRRSVQLSPSNVAAMTHLVLANLKSGQLRRARYWLNRARRLCPGQPQVRRLWWWLLAVSLVSPFSRVMRSIPCWLRLRWRSA